ncbi:phytanoyl-CoA dioxygenase family protein (plasmid) [Pseudoalteromonas sp. T1lg65]|uniref:phytanoyl-CoA dioxygenase family protein n=1 Tax=Pseudoalteromonas sp. T1lg65 TaxID=2077101 RepID=UPI003F79353F
MVANMDVTSNALLMTTDVLKRIWQAQVEQINDPLVKRRGDNFKQLQVTSDVLGIGTSQFQRVLFGNLNDFDAFIDSLLGIANPSAERLSLLAHLHYGGALPDWYRDKQEQVRTMPDVLNEMDLQQWREKGYVVLKNAVDLRAVTDSVNALCSLLNISLDNPNSWYDTKASEKLGGIMVDFIQHQALEANRNSLRIYKAFSQLWQTDELISSADRCSFNPPESESYTFQGPDLHWDLDFSKSLQFGTQGLLYLTDTRHDQGAFTAVPGFQHKLHDWLKDSHIDANQVDPNSLQKLGAVPIAGAAGDLIIWHQFLPHGSSPNRAARPRLVQYINMYPLKLHTSK